jgi:hypothetical protein
MADAVSTETKVMTKKIRDKKVSVAEEEVTRNRKFVKGLTASSTHWLFKNRPRRSTRS